MTRIALIHATVVSMDPTEAAFSDLWPEAETFHLLDSSLSTDRAKAGELTDDLSQRIIGMAEYAAERGVERVATVAVDLDFGEQRKADLVAGLAEVEDLLFGARLLAPELVAGEAEYAEFGVFAVQFLQAAVLRGQAAFAGDVDNEEDLAGEIADGGVSAGNGFDSDGVDGAHGLCFRYGGR